jgi:hypothetical protein
MYSLILISGGITGINLTTFSTVLSACCLNHYAAAASALVIDGLSDKNI